MHMQNNFLRLLKLNLLLWISEGNQSFLSYSFLTELLITIFKFEESFLFSWLESKLLCAIKSLFKRWASRLSSASCNIKYLFRRILIAIWEGIFFRYYLFNNSLKNLLIYFSHSFIFILIKKSCYFCDICLSFNFVTYH